jgi:CRISPR-associated protein Cas5h
MQAYQIIVSGRWGHFRRPEANNNPITYDFITKTAFIGMLSAVCGLRRHELKDDYEMFANKIYYNVQILNPIKKVAANFRIYKYKGSLSSVENPPQFYELLKEPKYKITFYGDTYLVTKAVENLKNKQAFFNPVFGLANCPANIEYLGIINIEEVSGNEILTQGFVPYSCSIDLSNNIMLSYDNIPVVQNNNWQNTKYEKVFYAQVSGDKEMKVQKLGSINAMIDSKNHSYFFI